MNTEYSTILYSLIIHISVFIECKEIGKKPMLNFRWKYSFLGPLSLGKWFKIRLSVCVLCVPKDTENVLARLKSKFLCKLYFRLEFI